MTTVDRGLCPFCERIAGDGYREERRGVVDFEPLSPVVPGHRLFVPRLHVSTAGEAPWVAANTFEVAAEYAAQVGADFNLITSAGSAATQTIRHLHVHYVPRYPADGLTLPWTGQLSEVPRG